MQTEIQNRDPLARRAAAAFRAPSRSGDARNAARGSMALAASIATVFWLVITGLGALLLALLWYLFRH